MLEQINSPADVRALSLEQLQQLAGDVRQAIIGQVSKSGGHLAPNLGVVELTLALHYVFDFAHDRLLFDVGHQCYPHKLVTGRRDMLAGLRTSRGMAGFPEPRESPYDLFSVGHAGTGISTAVGMARADTLAGRAYHSKNSRDGRRVATIIGDASIVNGVAMEGLNNAGTLRRQFLVVLNDNGMSISKPQGALAQYFDRLRLSHIYGGLKSSAKRILERVPGGSIVGDAYHAAGEATKAMINEGAWFEHFGLVTVGPIDGHDLPTLIEFLAEASEFDRPMVLWVKTVKGKGLSAAESDATRFHSPSAFKIQPDHDPDACCVEVKGGSRSFTDAFGDAMLDMMRDDPKVVVCTAAMPDGTGLTRTLAQFPDRAWDVGICESHAMDMMAGLARGGYRPFFAVYSTFLQRAFDQAFQEAALQGLPVRLCLDRAGLVGGDGAVHHGFCDVALLRTLPGACLMAAIDEPSLRATLEFMRTYDEGLSAVRYPRDEVSPMLSDAGCPAFELGRARLLTPDSHSGSAVPPDVAVLAFGTPALDALSVARDLSSEYKVAVYDARFAKPIDTGLLRELVTLGVPIITVEDHGLTGGFGSAVLEAIHQMGLTSPAITRLGLPDAWIYQNSREEQVEEAGIGQRAIERAIRAAVDASPKSAPHSGPAREDRPAGRVR